MLNFTNIDRRWSWQNIEDTITNNWSFKNYYNAVHSFIWKCLNQQNTMQFINSKENLGYQTITVIRWILEPCTEHVELHLSHSRIVAIMRLERGKIRVRKLLENDKKTNRARSIWSSQVYSYLVCCFGFIAFRCLPLSISSCVLYLLCPRVKLS